MYLDIQKLKSHSIELLKKLIKTPSFSKEENNTADLLISFLSKYNIKVKRKYNNVWAESNNYINSPPTILLNSHHDTIKPGKNWNKNPFEVIINNNAIIGLGSNDAKGSVVSLIASFIYLNNLPLLNYKLIILISAEEEISGIHGIKSILPYLGKIDLGIVGEPTNMNLAIAEKGIIVLDCYSYGKSGHSAREEGVNAIYIALKDINLMRNFRFKRVSKLLGNNKVTITQIQSGYKHNIIPDKCIYVADVRINELYDNEEVVFLLQKNVQSLLIPRSLNLKSSKISITHPIVKKALNIGIKTYGSPTLSDQSLMNFDTVKIGVGMSERSHTSNEFILISEIEQGIDIYINLLKDFSF